MKTQATTRAIRIVAVACLMAACLLAAYQETAQGGIQGSGARRVSAIGRITGFGSIFVNGIEYSTAHAQVSIDGQHGAETQLRVGQIVSLEGSLDPEERTGEASAVEFFGDAQGPVTRLNIKDRSFEVAGQTVRIDDDTLFGADGLAVALDALRKGTFVEVSGFPDAAGDLVASRIDLKLTGADLQVKGTVSSLDPLARTFRINALSVDYGAIAVEGTLVEGVTVKVQGARFSPAGELQAAHVQVQSSSAGSPGQYGDLQGLITSVASGQQFTLGAQAVTTDSRTRFSLRGQELAPNLSVRVKGVFNAAGVLVASKVTADAKASSILPGFVQSIADGTLTVAGVSLTLTDASVFSDHSALRLRRFGRKDLAVGDHVEVRVATEPGSQRMVVTNLKRKKPPGK